MPSSISISIVLCRLKKVLKRIVPAKIISTVQRAVGSSGSSLVVGTDGRVVEEVKKKLFASSSPTSNKLQRQWRISEEMLLVSSLSALKFFSYLLTWASFSYAISPKKVK